MRPLKSEDTLHHYIRLHFDKVSRVKAQALAERRPARDEPLQS